MMIKDVLLKKKKNIFITNSVNFKKIKLLSWVQNGVDTGLSSIYFSTSPMVLGHHFFIKKIH